MATIALNWELGADYGHIGRFLTIAQRLRALGHRPVCILRDISRAEQVLGSQQIEYLQAPLWLPSVQGLPPDLNFTETLLRFGFLQPDGLVAINRAWRALWTLLDPDLLVFDHAPTACLAARGLGLPRLLIGNSFSIPPAESPIPRYRWWQTGSGEQTRLAETEALVTHNVNAALMRLEMPFIQQVADLFEAEATLICGRPDLDVYDQRTNGTYIGPINNVESGAPPSWPAGDGPKVFAYLKPRYPHFEHLLQAFAQTSARYLIFAPGIANAVIQRHADKCLHFSTTPLCMAEVRTHCDAAVCHAGGTTDVMLEAGKPLLLLPMQMEQTMTSRRVESLGAGLHLPLEGNPGELGKLLKSVLTDTSYRKQAEAYAARQQCNGQSDAVGVVVERCEQLLARRQGA